MKNLDQLRVALQLMPTPAALFDLEQMTVVEVKNLSDQDVMTWLNDDLLEKVGEQPVTKTIQETGRWQTISVARYGNYLLASVTDITTLMLSLKQYDLLMQIIAEIISAPTIKAAVEAAIGTIVHECNLCYGECWYLDINQNHLRPFGISYYEDAALSELKDATADLRFRVGFGLPGEVWQKSKAIWSEDVSTQSSFLRRDLADKLGIKTGFGVPVTHRGMVLFVLVFFGYFVERSNQKLLDLVEEACRQIGSHFELLAQRDMGTIAHQPQSKQLSSSVPVSVAVLKTQMSSE